MTKIALPLVYQLAGMKVISLGQWKLSALPTKKPQRMRIKSLRLSRVMSLIDRNISTPSQNWGNWYGLLRLRHSILFLQS